MSDLQKDLVLSPNEYAYVLDETKGNVACNVGPHKMSLSQSDKLVKFDNKHKRFITCERYRDAIQLFTTAPEGWYIALKNPSINNKHPQPGTSNSIPENMQIGCKINIPGPVSFALYPGQMAQVIKGHSLRSNQYLIAKIYDAEALNQTDENKPDAEKPTSYVNGQTLIIKGTEVSFYIPPTGIEVKAINNNIENGYVRDAVTLERLEYCILKDEDGNKRYVHGPDVVFPNPTETFVTSPKGGYVFRAVELSKISGIYVKVIAEYKENDIVHPVGEELFITGNTQMIYYPRPEHAIISYDNKITHHAIAIPEGEGRYIMNRLTGEIKTVKGPAMYLPDPRTEVVVKRKLTPSQCQLWFPNNAEAMAYNHSLSEKMVEKMATTKAEVMAYLTSFSDTATMANLESNANIARNTSYTKPRSITLDNKYDGVVSIDVWTGYAINVISKNGKRQVVCGPRTVLLDYDQTLEVLELSTGKPKTTDNLEKVVFLRYNNGRVSDIIRVETKDFVKADIKVSYHIDFDEAASDKWFAVDNYVKHLCDWARSMVKKDVKNYTISEFHANYQEIFVEAISDADKNNYLHKFEENGMIISDVEILSMSVEPIIQKLIDEHQATIVSRTLDLTAAQNAAEMERQIIALNKEKVELAEQYERFKIEQEAETKAKNLALVTAQAVQEDIEIMRKEQLKQDIHNLHLKIAEAEREKIIAEQNIKIDYERTMRQISSEQEERSADAIAKVVNAIGPELAAALEISANQGVVTALAESISPYALANNESVSDAINTLLRGSSMEHFLKYIKKD